MPDCFISFVGKDRRLAESIHQDLVRHELDVFLAPISLQPGQDWSQEIQRALQNTRWVLFLASKEACSSPYVQQEVGGAFFGGKTIVPIVWDIAPDKLPGWAKQFQAVDLRGKTPQEIAARIQQVAARLRASKQKGNLIALGIIAGLLWLGTRGE